MATLPQESVRRYTWVYLLLYLAPSNSIGDINTDAAIKGVNECYDQCKSSYKGLYNLALAPLGLEKFVASQHCNAIVAADYTCNAIAGVHSCYRNCDKMATQYFVTYSPTEEYYVVEQLYGDYCFVDELNCRAMDSYYCQVSYNFRLCDQNLERYIQCVKDVQRARGCTVLPGLNCYPSQLVAQSLIFTSTKYCAMAPITDLVARNPGDEQYAVLQACESVIDYKCLGYLGNAGSGISFSFQSNANCEAFLQSTDCITSTVNSTILIGSTKYVAPCRLLPDAERTLLNLSDQLHSMMPANCRSNKSCLFQQSSSMDVHLNATLPIRSSNCLIGSSVNESNSNGGGSAKQNSYSGEFTSAIIPTNDLLYTSIASIVRETPHSIALSGSNNSEAATLPKMSSINAVVYGLVWAVITLFCSPNVVGL